MACNFLGLPECFALREVGCEPDAKLLLVAPRDLPIPSLPPLPSSGIPAEPSPGIPERPRSHRLIKRYALRQAGLTSEGS